jgi:hypothetical protein
MSEKSNLALDLLIESVMKPDENLRNHAKSQECYEELMYWRKETIDYLKKIRNKT